LGGDARSARRLRAWETRMPERLARRGFWGWLFEAPERIVVPYENRAGTGGTA
jgi:hypothetical protein